MGLDALGDEYWESQAHGELLRAVDMGKPKILEATLRNLSYGVNDTTTAERALDIALGKDNKNDLVAVLLGDGKVSGALSYRKLVETLEKTRGTPLEEILSDKLGERNRHMKREGITGHLNYLMGRKSSVAMVETTDIFVYAIETCDAASLKTLIEAGAEKYMDDSTENFMNERLAKKTETEKKEMQPLVDEFLHKWHIKRSQDQLDSIGMQVKRLDEKIEELANKKLEFVGERSRLLLRKDELSKQLSKDKA